MLYRSILIFNTSVLMFLTMNLAQAGPISGVTASTNMQTWSGFQILDIVNGHGLSPYTAGGTHVVADFGNAWVGLGSTGTITFNLGGVYNLSGMTVWNFNAVSTGGVRGVTVEGSSDGSLFTPIAGAPNVFAEGKNQSPESGEAFSFTTTASYIRFSIASNYANPSATGLSEVMFEEGSTEVPEPATFGVLALGLAGLAFLRRRP